MAVDRQRLIAQQEALVRALLDQGPVPEGFDRSAVRTAARSLTAKRARDADKLAARPQPKPQPRSKRRFWQRRSEP